MGMSSRRGAIVLLRLAGVILTVILAGSDCAANTVPNLGAAADFGLLGLNNAHYAIQSAAIAGNIGIGQGGTATNNSGSIAGTAIEYSSGQITNTGSISGGISINPTEMTNANAGALSAYNTAVGDTATQSFGAITSSRTITGNGGLNVVDIASVNLNNRAITLSGTSSDIFVLRIAGNFTMAGSAGIVLGANVSASRVLIVFTGTGTTINIGINATRSINGTLLAPSASTNWQIASGNFDGEIITGTPASGGGVYINLNNVNLTVNPFRPVPEPSSIVLAGVGSAGLVSLAWSKRKRWRNAVEGLARE